MRKLKRRKKEQEQKEEKPKRKLKRRKDKPEEKKTLKKRKGRLSRFNKNKSKIICHYCKHFQESEPIKKGKEIIRMCGHKKAKDKYDDGSVNVLSKACSNFKQAKRFFCYSRHGSKYVEPIVCVARHRAKVEDCKKCRQFETEVKYAYHIQKIVKILEEKEKEMGRNCYNILKPEKVVLEKKHKKLSRKKEKEVVIKNKKIKDRMKIGRVVVNNEEV